MAYSTRTYTPGSSTTTFALTTSGGDPIGYIQESDISVKVNGTTYTNAASGTNTYQISGTSTVEQPNGGNVVLNAGVTGTVILERTTAIQDATVVYTAGSTLTSTDLNNADNQIRFGLQEFSDDYAALLGTGSLITLGSFLGGGETWVSNDSKAATTAAIDGRIDTKATAKVKDDIIATAPVAIADDSPSTGKITVSVDAKLTELATMDQNTANSLADLTQAEVQILDGATLTTTELNYVDGVTSAVQTQIDGKQASDADLTAIAALAKTDGNIIVGDGSTWVAENGATARTSLGAQAAAADLTTLSSMQSGAATELASLTATELDILDGCTRTTAQLNYVDATSSIQTQLDGKQASGSYQAADADLTTLAGMQAGTASVLAGGTALTSTLTELNQLDGKTLGETSLTTNSNTAIPTSKAVADHVASSITAVGGLVAIAGPTNFPATQPAQGVVVSISDVGAGFTTSSNEITITNGAGTGNNVRITGFPTSLAATTLQDDTGIQVTSDKNNSTSGSPNVHRYVYHKWLAKEDDIKQLSDDINEFNERYRTDATGNNPTSNNHAGDLFFNQGSNTMYVRNGANNAWGEVTSVGDFKFLFLCPTGGSGAPTIDGSIDTYDLRETTNSGTLASITSAAQLVVSVNGVIQQPNSGTSTSGLDGFVMTDANTIKFAANLPNGADVFVIQIGSAVTLNAPANNTVSTDVLQSGAVTEAKIEDNAVSLAKMAHGTDGQIITYDASGAPVAVGPGTDGQVLTSTGAGSPPAFEAIPTPVDATKMPLAGGTFTGDVVFTGDAANVTWDKSEDDLIFNDNAKAAFGTGKDFTISFNSSNIIFENDSSNTGGDVYFYTDDFIIGNVAKNETVAHFKSDGACELYYDSNKEFATKSGGVHLFGHSQAIVTTLSSAATVTINFSLSNHFEITMGHNVTFDNPTTESQGQSGAIVITQPGSGGPYTASWGSQFLWAGGTAPTLSTAANAVDRIDYFVAGADKIHCVASLDVK